MPGLYTVTSRAPGTLITELIYNGDHQNHVDGRCAELMGSYGVSAAQMQLTEDPYPGSVESLPDSLAGEITRLRFTLAQIISELSGGADANWYDTLAAPGFAYIGARVQRSSIQTIPHATSTVITFSGGTADFNSGVWDDMTQPTRFTAPVAGKYLAACSIAWSVDPSGGTRRQVQLGVNSVFSNNAVVSNLTVAGVSQAQTLTGLVDLAANDYVQFLAYQNSGASTSLIVSGASSIVGSLVYLGS